jgi:hypothetical protein
LAATDIVAPRSQRNHEAFPGKTEAAAKIENWAQSYAGETPALTLWRRARKIGAREAVIVRRQSARIALQENCESGHFVDYQFGNRFQSWGNPASAPDAADPLP